MSTTVIRHVTPVTFVWTFCDRLQLTVVAESPSPTLHLLHRQLSPHPSAICHSVLTNSSRDFAARIPSQISYVRWMPSDFWSGRPAVRFLVGTTCSTIPLQSFYIFCASKIVLVWLKINFILFMLFEVIFVLLVFCKLFEPNRCLTLKMNSDDCDSFSHPCQSWISRLSYNHKWNQAIMLPFSLFCLKM